MDLIYTEKIDFTVLKKLTRVLNYGLNMSITHVLIGSVIGNGFTKW